MKLPEEQELRAKVEQVRERLRGLDDDLRVVDSEVEALAPRRNRHELLEQACDSLEGLDRLGAASLFWGERFDSSRVREQLQEARGRVAAFQAEAGEVDRRRLSILAAIGHERENLEILGEDLYDVRQAEERRKDEWFVEREISPLPRRVQVMAWARGGEEDRRFHKMLVASLFTGVVFGSVLPMIDLPLPERFQPDQMPKRIVQLVRDVQAKPVPPPRSLEPLPEPKPPEKPETPKEPRPEDPPKPTDRPGPLLPEAPPVAAVEPQTQRTVQKAGILAFKDKFASLSRDKVAPRLGSDARFTDADDVSDASSPTRALLTSNAPGSSGGIDLASLSRNVGGGGGGRGGGGGGGIEGVPLGRATSPIASIGGGGRPLAKDGPLPSRTDEEIQIVFDRYKAAFYRLYNRELRKDPSLRGQMVLQLTIEPDGSVSMCMLQSTDMDAPELADQVVSRVRGINFGAKDGVRAMTIVYPIDFLPAA